MKHVLSKDGSLFGSQDEGGTEAEC